MIYALILAMALVEFTSGCVSYNRVDKQPSMPVEPQGKLIMTYYVYIFDDNTQLWNRARKETLMKADCNKIRLLTVNEDDGVLQ